MSPLNPRAASTRSSVSSSIGGGGTGLGVFTTTPLTEALPSVQGSPRQVSSASTITGKGRRPSGGVGALSTTMENVVRK